MAKYREITNDKGRAIPYLTSDNNSEYVVTSAYGHDRYREFRRKYDRLPSSSWFRRIFEFERVK